MESNCRIKLICPNDFEQWWLMVSAKYIVVIFSCVLVDKSYSQKDYELGTGSIHTQGDQTW